MHQPSSPQTFSLSRPDEEVTLLELADRLLHRGVVLTGEATISVAGVDLIYLGLNVVLTGVENLHRGAGGSGLGIEADGPAPARGTHD